MKCDYCKREIEDAYYDYRGGICNRIDCFDVGTQKEKDYKEKERLEQNQRDIEAPKRNKEWANNRHKKEREMEEKEMRGEDMPVGYINSDEKYEEHLAVNNII